MTDRMIEHELTTERSESRYPFPHERYGEETRENRKKGNMVIQVAAGTGEGHTTLSAFDAALRAAGVANYNLIQLSSIIPPGAEVMVADGPIADQPGKWGDRLYVVKADKRVETEGEEAWAAIGWVQDPETGMGLFVEHEGGSKDTVSRKVEVSLEDLQRNRNMDLGEMCMKVAGITYDDVPVCALVVAAYQAEGWVPATAKMPAG